MGDTLPSFQSYDDFVACKRARSVDMRIENEGVIVGLADGKDLANPIGGGMVVKIRDGDTAGAYSVHDNAIPPVSAGPRIHRRHEEAYYVLAGELSVQVGPRTIAAPVDSS
jgi:mannose-6-phosphate isomerase-like protein (cupin superfamily)